MSITNKPVDELYFHTQFIAFQISLLIIGSVVNDHSILSILEACFLFFMIIDKLGKGMALRELIAFHTSFVLLFMPTIGYWYYSASNPLAKHWSKYMPIGDEEYFSFVFPAVLIFNLILCWPINRLKNKDFGGFFIENYEKTINKLSISKIKVKLLLISGTFIYFLTRFLPVSLQYFGYLSFTASFAAFLMLYLDNTIKYRKIAMLYFFAFLLYASISTTMFTLVVYMGMTMFAFFFLNLNLSFPAKFGLFVTIALLVMSLQYAKSAFRSGAGNIETQNRALYLGELLLQEASSSYTFFSPEKFFGFYVRTNQGFLVAKVIDYIPRKKEYDNGRYLGQAIFSALIPRIFWPDKPTAGGRFTFEYFTGDKLVGFTSMNVSPVGEAYGSFGPVLGIVYMSILALFVRGVYLRFISLTYTIPFLIFWFPVVFYQLTYSMETDSLQIFNSLFKSGIFVFILYVISPSLFGVERKSLLSLK